MNILIRPPRVGRWPLLGSRLCPLNKPPSTRNFHASKTLYSVDGPTIQVASNIFDLMHNLTGLPWGIAIPLTAILFRSCFSIPINALIFRNQRRQLLAEPLAEAYRNAAKIQTRRHFEQQNRHQPSAKDLAEYAYKRAALWVREKFAISPVAPVFFTLPLLYYPFWDRSCNILSRMCGLANWGEAHMVNIPHQIQSLASEGLLWFPDLTAFDPTLSTTFVLLCVLNARSAAWGPPSFADTKEFLTVSLRASSKIYKYAAVLGSGAFGVFILNLHLPAAAALFQVSSSLCALVLRSLMKKVMLGRSGRLIEPARRKSVVMRKT